MMMIESYIINADIGIWLRSNTVLRISQEKLIMKCYGNYQDKSLGSINTY